ncbi:hypothetical protein N4Q63_16095 [Leclercia adecarboxylata]|uniref:Uncharacterized protein n=1 Tax=Leclercia adecarboxylata TaxID=83655 RepID=A0A9X3YBR3_9ENTR|nr:hypothetical protein [Leclercia adecarboxylata]MBD1404341.1 hypothetical protein [Leclercia adecarboxylata]MDC6623351.1 hypothetical protein [Leclercia adecarboxylata]MDC6634439.1 hypothetical protein [Leclercia adecarboxylata]MDC6639553.1 hypothetical protein [Leclercia adecarboxylata]MDC6650421.1 hypothetical protein [Leclercia adecarboxylata]
MNISIIKNHVSSLFSSSGLKVRKAAKTNSQSSNDYILMISNVTEQYEQLEYSTRHSVMMTMDVLITSQSESKAQQTMDSVHSVLFSTELVAGLLEKGINVSSLKLLSVVDDTDPDTAINTIMTTCQINYIARATNNGE